MGLLAVGLDDRAVAVAGDGRVLSVAPSVVFNGADATRLGEGAWARLRLQPRTVSTQHLAMVLNPSGALPDTQAAQLADEVLEAELRERLGSARAAGQPVAAPDRVWFTVPAHFEPAGLTAVWGIAQRLQMPLDGFMDAAAVTAAAVATDRDVIVLELGLHHAAATAVDCEGAQVRRRGTAVADRGGLLELYQVWLELVSRTLVHRTRFDPLHSAATEQQLFDLIPHLAGTAQQAGTATVSLAHRHHVYEAELTRDQFEQAADPLYRSWMALLHPLRSAGAPVSVVVPEQLAGLPGLRERFEVLVGSELITVADGFAPLVTSMLDLPMRSAEDSDMRLLRRVPRTSGNVLRMPLGERRASGPAPSHVLWNGTAYSLGPATLLVGRGASGPGSISLPEGLAAVSRRHCSFVQDGSEVTLLDHSSFGTYVNGERVYEKARVHAGDRVRVGESGVELALIAVQEGSEALP